MQPHVPGSELFPEKGSSYVPSGLSMEEYQKIKKSERDALQKMNFGLWGPRFLRPSRTPPGGDWFLMPTLWTAGFRAGNNNVNDKTDQQNNKANASQTDSTLFRKAKAAVKIYGPPYILAFVMIDVLVSMYTMMYASQITIRSALRMAFRMTIWKLRNPTIVWQAFGVMHLVKGATSAVLTLPMLQWIKYANQKWSWNTRRTMISTIAAYLGVLLVWATACVGIRKFVLGM